MAAMMRTILFLVLAIVAGQLWLPTTAEAAYRYANEDCVSECSGTDSLVRYLWHGYANQQATVQATTAGSQFFVDFIDGFFVPKKAAPNAEQAANLKRFQKKIPSNSKDSVELRELPNGGVAAQATSPGKVPGSKAVYEKQIDVNGQTIQVTKTTYDPQGNIVHVKDKLNGRTYP
ncbi:hypothetical protein [Fastidiosibacter lacustris]|uniref:hypothetical protein n=1 Tax=Fastidiosibacter lacustris TaxID=2056695 RepID=UPI00195B4A0F|nr:hypothetical protein [Fastidiosibacter lacustris]